MNNTGKSDFSTTPQIYDNGFDATTPHKHPGLSLCLSTTIDNDFRTAYEEQHKKTQVFGTVMNSAQFQTKPSSPGLGASLICLPWLSLTQMAITESTKFRASLLDPATLNCDSHLGRRRNRWDTRRSDCDSHLRWRQNRWDTRHAFLTLLEFKR